MEIRHMQYLVTIAEYRSITRAAEALYISQPSLSHCVAKAEKELGARLFDRSTSPMTLTYAGETFVNLARQILSLDQTMQQEFRDISQNMKGRLRIGMPNERATFMLPEIIPRFSREYPKIDLQVTTGSRYTLFKALDQGRIDFVIVPFRGGDPDYTLVPLAKEDLLFVAKKGTIPSELLVRPGHIDISRTGHLKYVLLRHDHAIRHHVDALFAVAGIQPEVALEAPSNLTKLRLVAAGTGVGIVPRMTLLFGHCIDEIDVFSIGSDTDIWDIPAIFRRGTYIGTVERRFIEIAAETYHAAVQRIFHTDVGM